MRVPERDGTCRTSSTGSSIKDGEPASGHEERDVVAVGEHLVLAAIYDMIKQPFGNRFGGIEP